MFLYGYEISCMFDVLFKFKGIHKAVRLISDGIYYDNNGTWYFKE